MPYPVYRNSTWLFLPTLLLITLLGCDANDDIEYAHPQLEFKFAPGALQQAPNVNRVVVTIEGPDLDPISQEFRIDPGQQSLDVELPVPLGATSIRVEAFEVDETGQERLAFTGESPIGDLTEATPKITVLLGPATANVKLEASETDLTINDTFTVEIALNEVSDLFAMTLELDFNPQLVAPIDVSAGPLFEANPLKFDDRGLGGPENRLGIAIARQGGTTGVSGSGVVATVRFQAKGAGQATIRVAPQTESEVFTLQRPDGALVSGFERLAAFLTRAEVVVNIQQ